jgi:hypothetical protein
MLQNYVSISFNRYSRLITNFHSWSNHNCGRMLCLMCLLSTVQGLVRIQQSTLNRYWHAFTFCTVGLSQEGLRQKINPISCSLLVVCRLWDRWQATSHILFLLSKPICTALWFTAHITVCKLMCLQVKAITEMPLHSTLISDRAITLITAKWPLSTVYALMCLQSILQTEWLITLITAKWPLSTVYALMCFQSTSLTEWPVTHIISKRMLASVCCTLLPLQRTPKIEKLITNIKAKWPMLNL